MEIKRWEGPLSMDIAQARAHLHIGEDDFEEFQQVYDRVLGAATGRAVFGSAQVSHLDETTTRVGESIFTSKLLAINFQDVHTVYPYVCTSGRELYDMQKAEGDPLYAYWIDALAEMLLGRALEGMRQAMIQAYGQDQLYAMNPGSLPDWPLREQGPLFSLLGDVRGEIGVELTKSFLMVPVKSSSGLMFHAKEHYTNCALCPRGECTGRREPFNAKLYAEKYGVDVPTYESHMDRVQEHGYE